MNYYHYIDIRRRVLCTSQAVPFSGKEITCLNCLRHCDARSAEICAGFRRVFLKLSLISGKISGYFQTLISYPGSLALAIVKMPNFTFYRQCEQTTMNFHYSF